MLSEESICHDPLLKEEQRLIQFIGSVCDKKDWQTKLKTLWDKWSDEAATQGLSQELLNYCRKELDYISSLGFRCSPAIQGTFVQYDLIDSSLRDRFKSQVIKLEQVDPSELDWHPNTTQVLDLVHPSLYPIRFGKTIMKTEDGIQLVPVRKVTVVKGQDEFQWLPSEFEIAENGQTQIQSYINNLHPIVHADLYKSIADVFSKFVDMFELCLGQIEEKLPPRIPMFDWWEDQPSDIDEMTDDQYDEWHDNRQLKPTPIPEEYKGSKFPIKKLKGTTVQVIVKIASIILTPENPVYEGGSWHIEGTDSENIVSTGIYYYDTENITESKLSFRQAVNEYFYYEQGDNTGVSEKIGLEDGEALNQYLGSVTCSEGKCIVFPNTLQHKVEPFELLDKTRPGHRKIMCFFVVDPTIRIPSTKEVPPQQKEWVEFDVQSALLPVLPVELVSKVVSSADWLMSLKEAKKTRLELMDKRTNVNDEYFEQEFSLCEH
ncbi:hypothetical protein EDD86DRAFT_190615 [Gorgonomyces haynaldii]|nr:hypothetical protein EDD86DRAFT_190615 [Gorgonomyces haynaldii]